MRSSEIPAPQSVDTSHSHLPAHGPTHHRPKDESMQLTSPLRGLDVKQLKAAAEYLESVDPMNLQYFVDYANALHEQQRARSVVEVTERVENGGTGSTDMRGDQVASVNSNKAVDILESNHTMQISEGGQMGYGRAHSV